MSEERRQYFMRSLRVRAGRLIRLVDLDTPVPIVAHEVASILLAALGLAGKDVLSSIGEWLEERILVSAGFCPTEGCEGRLTAKQTWTPTCEDCARESEEPEVEEDGGGNGE